MCSYNKSSNKKVKTAICILQNISLLKSATSHDFSYMQYVKEVIGVKTIYINGFLYKTMYIN
jgi:hypothetical protein